MKTTRILLAAATLAISGGLASCAATLSAVTGDPIPTTPVSREGGKPFNVATADVLRAEASPPETAWGTYNAGATAATLRETVNVGK